MASELGIEQDSVCGKLVRVWVWADQNIITGNGMTITEAFLDRLTCPGFAAALRAVKWLKGEDKNLSFPNFSRHNGKTAKSRGLSNQRKAKFRASGNDNGTLAAFPKRGPEKRREEKSTSKDVQDSGANGSPPTDEEWLAAFEKDPTYEGIEVRREFGKMQSWCKANKKTPTRKRFVNWLNRADRTITIQTKLPYANGNRDTF